MITPRDLLEHYVRRYNHGVKTGDFAPLFEMFLPAARAEIERALRERPPRDELVIVRVRELDESRIEADFAGGKLELELRSGSIARLHVTPA